MQLERSVVQFGKTPIRYSIRRSARRGTVTIAVDPRDGVLLLAPSATTVERLDRLVHKKARWIVTQMRARGDHASHIGHDFVTGETFLYLGRQYRLRLVPSAKEVSLQGQWLRAPGGSASASRRELVRWYREHAVERLRGRVAEWATILRVDVPPVLVRDQRKRWGSCDVRGHLRFNWRIVQAPRRLIDYVVVHELVHLQHRSHTKRFWTALRAVMPDYKVRREALRAIGPSLVW